MSMDNQPDPNDFENDDRFQLTPMQFASDELTGKGVYRKDNSLLKRINWEDVFWGCVGLMGFLCLLLCAYIYIVFSFLYVD